MTHLSTTRAPSTTSPPSRAARAAWAAWAAWAGATAFEWTKLASVRSTRWILGCAVLVSLGGSWLLGASALASGRNGHDTATPAPEIAAQTLLVSQVAVVVIAALAICGEYATGSIVTSLQSVPVRGRLLAAKALTVAGVSAVAGAVFVVLGTPVAELSAEEFGTFTGAEFRNAATGAALGMALLSLLVLGLGTALRNAAATIVSTLAILQVLSAVLPLFDNEAINGLADHLPNEALTVLVTHPAEPYTWPVAVLTLAGWAAAGLTAGYAVLRARDA
ncbi:ABC transporter [Streptomyces sp. 3MP-14]|uniref:ABC transporter n=1 Tax=Streptomyces mimosae TaxID=2586635 RepID=A0A5N6AP04_9ACTN|nr:MULTISPECIES: ABC transporter [Streptomyces]KAB8169852.1 ABC transporter [Streptomyces mimosae]KAB8178600.1 ABC transporter [Streptomyces sp. 3MP-14]